MNPSDSRATPYPSQPRPLLFAHRGYSSRAPENTLAAFRLAASEGIPGIELDVQLTSDKEVVVIHDFDLRRVAGIPDEVSQTSSKDIRSLDAGTWFSPQFGGEGVPLFREVLEALGTSVYYDIELKQREDDELGLEEAVAKLVAEYDIADSVMVSSFSEDLVRRFKETAPEIPVALIFSSRKTTRDVVSGNGWEDGIRYDVLKPYYRRVKPISGMTRRNKVAYPLITWTVNSVRGAQRLRRIGVEGIISDDPAPIQQALSL